ncbi:MAG: TonB-dependent receptor, partial [Saprospiraceae bacterium]|nr:TonB-dependent receptor [Saprospiraceae bacterium]
GGVINLITKKSQIARFDTELNSHYENNGFKTLTARAGYSKNKWICQITGNMQQFIPNIDTFQGRDQIWNPKVQKSARTFIRYTPSEDFDIRLSANILDEKVDNQGEKRRTVFKPYSFDDEYLTDRYDVNLHMDQWTKSKNLFQTTLGYNYFNRIKNSYRFDFDEEKKSLIDGMQDTASSSGFLTRFTFAHDNKKRSWNYLLGLENYFETAIGSRLRDSNSSVPGKAFTNDLGVFASGKIRIGKQLTLQSGARWTLNMRYGSAISPSTSLFWQPKLPLQFRLSWAYGFRSPSLKELFFNFIDVNHFVVGNSNLKPEYAVNLRGEITLKTLRSKNSELALTTTGFYNKIDNRIILSALGPVHYEYRNVENWETKGGSLRLSGNIVDWCRFQSEVITTGFYNSNAEISQHEYLWSTDWTNDLTISLFKNKLSWNIWHKRTGKTPFFYNKDGKTEQGLTESFHILNMGLSTHFVDKRIRINTGIKNIFNIRQLASNNNNGIHIEASNQQNLHWGRTFYINLILQWND